jgi:hypothetical protein
MNSLPYRGPQPLHHILGVLCTFAPWREEAPMKDHNPSNSLNHYAAVKGLRFEADSIAGKKQPGPTHFMKFLAFFAPLRLGVKRRQ